MDYFDLIGAASLSFLALVMSQVAGMALGEGGKSSFLLHSALSLVLAAAAVFAAIRFGMGVSQ